MLRITDETEELDSTEESEDDEDMAIGDDALDEMTDEDTAEADTEGFGHVDEAADADKLDDEDEEEDDEELPLEDDAEDVDYDSFDDIDEF